MNMDLFSQAGANESPIARCDDSLLDSVMSECGRKSAMKLLDESARNALAQAIAVVAAEKRAAYERARAGCVQESLGWIPHKRALARALATLNDALVDASVIPMAGKV